MNLRDHMAARGAAPLTAQPLAQDPYGVGASAPDPATTPLMTVTLSRPLKTHKGDTIVINLKEPNWGDFIELGEIERVYILELDEANRPAKMESAIDRQALSAWMSRLSGLDRHVLSGLSIQDGRKLEAAVRKIVMAVSAGNSQAGSTS